MYLNIAESRTEAIPAVLLLSFPDVSVQLLLIRCVPILVFYEK